MTKKKYNNPEIVEIRLDNEISLQLASDPYTGPGENGIITNNTNSAQEVIQEKANSPYQDDLLDW